MTRDRERLARLAELAALKRDADQARLAKHVRAQAVTEARLGALRAGAAAAAALPPDPALWAAQQRHRQWAETQRKALNAELARERAATMAARAVAARSTGRAAVLARLAAAGARRRVPGDHP